MNNRCLPSIFIIVLFMVCGILVLFACKQDDKITTSSTTQSTSEATTEMPTLEKTRYQVTQEELVQYGGTAGMIKYIDDYIEENKVVEDIRNIKVLEPLIKLYFNYTDLELQEHFNTSSSEIEGAVAKAAKNITNWTVNASFLGKYLSLGNDDNCIHMLYDAVQSQLEDSSIQTLSRALLVELNQKNGYYSMRTTLGKIIQFDKNYKYVEITIPETDGKKTVDLNFSWFLSSGMPSQVFGIKLFWNLELYGQVMDVVIPQNSVSISTELFDNYFSGNHDLPVKFELDEKQSSRGLSDFYKSISHEGYEDWLIIDTVTGTYLGIRFIPVKEENAPVVEDIMKRLSVFWPYDTPDIEKYKVKPSKGIVVDAYSMDFQIEYIKPNTYTNSIRIPALNNDSPGAVALNEKIKKDFLSYSEILVYFERGVSFSNSVYNYSYSYQIKDNIVAISITKQGGWMDSEAWYDYIVYYYDVETDMELSVSQYLERCGISSRTVVKHLIKTKAFSSYFIPGSEDDPNVENMVELAYAVINTDSSVTAYVRSKLFVNEYSDIYKVKAAKLPDMERYKTMSVIDIVSNAYALYEKINYKPLFGEDYWHTSIFYVPKINSEGAEELNERILRDCLPNSSYTLYDILDGTASSTGASINISYEFTQKDNLLCIMICNFGGQLASEAYVVYWGYYFDLSEKREITMLEYIKRAGIDINFLLDELNSDEYFNFYWNEMEDRDKFRLTINDIKNICNRNDGTYDVYIDVTRFDYDYGSVIHVRMPFYSRGQWFVYKEKSGYKYYEQVVFQYYSSGKPSIAYSPFPNRSSIREYELDWLDENTVAVKYWTDDKYSSFYVADLSAEKADCDFNIPLAELFKLCGISRAINTDGKSSLDISFSRVTGTSADRIVYASFNVYYEDLLGTLTISGEISMKMDGSGMQVKVK